MDNSVDTYIARSAERVIVSVEEIVSTDQVRAHPQQTFLPREYVTAVVHAPFGAHPCCCDSRYGYDQAELRRYYDATASADSFDEYVKQLRADADHWAYLDRIGIAELLTSSTRSSSTLGVATA
jgi:glutaconate CoA-transferase subunit A